MAGRGETSEFKLQTSENNQGSNVNRVREIFKPRKDSDGETSKHQLPTSNETPSSNIQAPMETIFHAALVFPGDNAETAKCGPRRVLDGRKNAQKWEKIKWGNAITEYTSYTE